MFAVFFEGLECYGTRSDTYQGAYAAGVAAFWGEDLANGTACVLEVD